MIIELEPDLITILETRAKLLDVEPDLLINYSLRYQVPLEKIRGIDLAMDDVMNGRDNLRSINEKFRRVGNASFIYNQAF